jgi:hypothetical protein
MINKIRRIYTAVRGISDRSRPYACRSFIAGVLIRIVITLADRPVIASPSCKIAQIVCRTA